MMYLGDFAAGATVFVPFHTFNSSGASVTISGLATSDIKIYKNGSTTQRSSTAGFTLLDTDGIDFDGITGIHGFSIDLSDNTDASFYASAKDYFVVVDAITVNAQTVSMVAACFSIENRSALRPTTAGRTLVVDANGLADANVVKAGPTGSGTAQTAGDVYGLLNGAQAEPGQGAPAVNASPLAKISYLYKAWRNKVTQTATTYSLFADDASTVDQKATVSDDATTFTRGEIAPGP